MGEVKAKAVLKKGAEATLYLAPWHGRNVIIKARLPKKYRPAKLDNQIRTYRTVHEPQLVSEAKKAGVPTPTIFLVDFGLGEKNSELEAKGVDLHLMKRALQSTHYQFAEECFKAVTRGYMAVLGESQAKDVLTKIMEIERRGRYVAERKQEAKNEVSA